MSERDNLETLQAKLQNCVVELHQQWAELGLADDVNHIEVDFIEQQVSNELGVIGAVTLGLSVIHSSLKALLPATAATPIVTATWALGGAWCIFRLTAGTVASWVHMLDRNKQRKRRLIAKIVKIEAVEEQIRVLAKLVAELQPGMNINIQPARQPQPHPSPTHSDSSAELVDLPEDMEEEIKGAAGPSSSSKRKSLDSLRQYASLSDKKK